MFAYFSDGAFHTPGRLRLLLFLSLCAQSEQFFLIASLSRGSLARKSPYRSEYSHCDARSATATVAFRVQLTWDVRSHFHSRNSTKCSPISVGSKQERRRLLNRAFLWIPGSWEDVRFSMRQFRRAPRYAMFTVLVPALGIGTVTRVFTVSYGVLLKPLPLCAHRQLPYAGRGGDQVLSGFERCPIEGDSRATHHGKSTILPRLLQTTLRSAAGA